MRDGRYGSQLQRQFVVLLAGALSGDPWERRRFEDHLPEPRDVCRRPIQPGEVIAVERGGGGRVAHSSCAPAPDGAYTGISPEGALSWLRNRRRAVLASP
jgi:hypothetical protein